MKRAVQIPFLVARVSAAAMMVTLAACARPTPAPPSDAAGQPDGSAALRVIAAETFLADIAQQVAGERIMVRALIPIGVDPHGYQPTPLDVAVVADCTVLIVNGMGFEAFLDSLLQNAGGERLVIDVSAGLVSREAREGEEAVESPEEHAEAHHHDEGDPHFWLDPTHVIHYVENIREGLSKADPAGAATYSANAEAYIAQLRDLDAWIQEQVSAIPPEARKLVTNHESFGYFADRYGFQIVGTVVPNISPMAAPSAQELARLVDRVREAGVKAIFLESGSNAKLAEQLAAETGIRVVTELYTHSLTPPGGPASSYIDMMRYNTQAIVEALK